VKFRRHKPGPPRAALERHPVTLTADTELHALTALVLPNNAKFPSDHLIRRRRRGFLVVHVHVRISERETPPSARNGSSFAFFWLRCILDVVANKKTQKLLSPLFPGVISPVLSALPRWRFFVIFFSTTFLLNCSNRCSFAHLLRLTFYISPHSSLYFI
jgi:hypothetical protein